MTLVPPGRGEGIKTYDPKDVVLTWKGIEIKGFADGAFVEAERDEDGLTKHVGSQGPVKHVKRSGTCTITLMREAPGNEVLDDLERLIREQCTAEVIEKPDPLNISWDALERLIERNPHLKIISTSGSSAFRDFVSRIWSIDSHAFLKREAKKDRRRVRMARKRRRGWA